MKKSYSMVKSERDTLRNRIINLEMRVNQTGVHSETDPKKEKVETTVDFEESKEPVALLVPTSS